MNPVQTWGQAIATSLIDLWVRFINFVPTLIGALLVFLIGVVIASILGKVVERVVKALRVDQALERINLGGKLKEHGIKISLSEFLGKLVQWFLVLVFLMAATDILGLTQVTSFLNSILLYLPNVVVATIILSIAFLLGNLVFTIVRSSTRAAGVMNASFLATIIRWAIVVFGLLAALIQLGIATSLVNTIFIGLVAAISLAVGLAFGLGGREEAALLLRKIREDIVEKK
ncbi:MAG: TM helix repeat-containing protein [uncultured bacterium]|nr:MAG: TM helix repeat-containing protein [uncultured bacterium]